MESGPQNSYFGNHILFGTSLSRCPCGIDACPPPHCLLLPSYQICDVYLSWLSSAPFPCHHSWHYRLFSERRPTFLHFFSTILFGCCPPNYVCLVSASRLRPVPSRGIVWPQLLSLALRIPWPINAIFSSEWLFLFPLGLFYLFLFPLGLFYLFLFPLGLF